MIVVIAVPQTNRMSSCRPSPYPLFSYYGVFNISRQAVVSGIHVLL